MLKLKKLMAVLVENKKAFFDHEILEKFESGIALTGQEVKSIKSGRVNLAGSYVVLRGGEAFWVGANIPPYQPKNAPKEYDPERARKLLLRKEELKSLIGKGKEKGLTLLPLRVYTKGAKIKLEFGIAKGRRKSDKRELIKKREAQRNIEKELKTRG
jgi:SsrA-binding protein